MFKTKKQAFTLVELIVVIVILAILATIAFLSFSSQSASARDSTRLSDMSNIAKGLSVFSATSGKVPMPDNKIDITASGITIGYQGYAGSQVLNMIKISNGGKDPLDTATYYTYSTNASRSKLQILGFLEDGSNTALSLTPFKGFEANADPSSYSGRYALSKGDQLGILLNGSTYLPIQTSGSNVDLVKSQSGTTYKAVFSNENSGENQVASGGLIFSSIYTRSPDLAIDKSLSTLDESLIGYWDMETTMMSGSLQVLKDLSKYGNNGTCYDGLAIFNCGTAGKGPQIVDGSGKTGKAMYFNGDTSWIKIDNNLNNLVRGVGKGVTIFSKLKVISYGQKTYSGSACTGWSRIIDFGNGPNSGNLALIYSSSNTYKFSATTLSGTSHPGNYMSNSPIEKDTYMTLGFRNSGNGSWGNYVNGSAVASTMSVAGTTLYDTNNLNLVNNYIGRSNWDADCLANYVLDELRIYNRGLSDAEISSLNSANR